MEIRELKYFLAVAREENLTRAAQSLYITQPSLTRQMQALEREIGRPLFVRGGRRMLLTEAGVLLRKRAEELLELYEKTQAELALPGAVCGAVKIGGGESFAFKLVADIAKQIRDGHHGVTFDIYSGNAEDIGEKLDKGLLDFGIFVEPADLSRYDSLRLPCSDTWGVLMRRDAPTAAKEYITPDELRDCPLIFSKQAYKKNTITAWFKTDLDKLNVVATYNLLYNASLMVEAGMGYAVCLDKIVGGGVNGGLCFRQLSPRLESGLNIAWKKNQIFSGAAQLFLEKLQNAFA